jgi:diguanylate cyclase (GGDEF)-like protein
MAMAFDRGTMNQRVLLDLKKRSTIGIFFYVVLSIICVVAGDFYQRHPMLSVIFLSANAVICLLRLIHLKVTEKLGQRHAKANKRIFFVSVIITALIWGVTLALITFLKEESATQLLMTVCICGLCAGGVVAFIPHKPLSIGFNISMMLPVVAVLLVTGSNIPLATMIFLFSVYMALMAVRGSREYWDALENEYLLETKSRELSRLSNTDVLTGLYNRRYFDEMLDAEWKRSGRQNSMLSAIIFDLDHFKIINDTYGHQVGDEYLKKSADILASVFKRETDVVARFGGEEFIVLLPGITSERAFQLAENARQRIESMALEHQGHNVRTTISAGISHCIPDFPTTTDSIVSYADQALYKAKQEGRNRIAIYMSTDNRQPGSLKMVFPQ